MNYYQADQEIPEDDVYDYGFWDLNRILVGMGFSSNFACGAQRNMSTSGSSISLQRKLMETYQVLVSQTKYALGSI